VPNTTHNILTIQVNMVEAQGQQTNFKGQDMSWIFCDPNIVQLRNVLACDIHVMLSMEILEQINYQVLCYRMKWIKIKLPLRKWKNVYFY